MFRLKLFGSACIDGPDGPVTGRAVQRRRLALLALLAAARDRGVTRDKLVGYLWPDSDGERARHQLSDSVYRINQAVGGEAISAVGDELRINPQRLPSDLWEFSDAMERGDWKTAASLHTAPFLDGFFLTDCDELERWVDGQRERLARERARALEQLAEEAEQSGDFPAAVHWWRSLAVHDPLSSRIALRLMRALDGTGERAAALQHARVHAALLDEELGLAPDAELLELVEELKRPPVIVASPVPPAPLSPPPVSAEPAAGIPPAGGSVAPDTVPARPRQRWVVPALAMLTVAAIAIIIAALQRGTDGPQGVAVLPFADLSAGGEYEYLADGITEELIARLAQVEGLHVVGRTSAFAFKGRAVNVRDVAAQLNVSSVIEGSVRYSGDRLRVVAQLSDARNGYQIWTETYERGAADVFEVQDEIAREIVTRLRSRLSGAEAARVVERPGSTDDAEAFNLYLRGRWQWHRRTEQSLRASVEFFRQAIERQPGYARAYAGLGDAYAVLGFYDFVQPREAFPAAAAAANRALELEPAMAEPHATLAYVALYHDWDWPRAEREFRSAIEIAPAYSTAHQWLGNLLTATGRFDEAIAAMGEAMRLDPLSLIANAAQCWSFYHAGQTERAIEQCTRALDLDANFALAHLWRAWAYDELGDFPRAIADYERAVELSNGSANHVTGLARGHARAGDIERARALLTQLRARAPEGYVPPYELARVYEALGDVDAAMEALERAHEHRSHSMAFLAVDPQLKGLRSDARFRKLVRQVGLDRTPGARWLR